MLCHPIFRYIHMGSPSWSSTNKALLAKLRKKTGFTFANCKKALELNGYNSTKAEEWLQNEAQALGWSRATKLEGRATAQGLVGVALEKNFAAIVEVNCETDFVARNKHFQMMVETAATACLQFSRKIDDGAALSKVDLSADVIKNLHAEDGKSLSDHLALVIGSIGENLALRRATCFKAVDSITLSGYAHPAPMLLSQLLIGKFGAILAFQGDLSKTDENLTKKSLDEVGRQLCQHVVGMNPLKIGVRNTDIPASNPDDEQCMIYQEYLLDPSQTVGQLMADTGIAVLDFARYECGEQVEPRLKDSNLGMAAQVGS